MTKKRCILIGLLLTFPLAINATDWQVVGTMQVPRANMCTATLETGEFCQFYLMGGRDTGGKTSNVCEVFTIDRTGKILEQDFTKDTLNIARYRATAFQYNGKIFVTGGFGPDNHPVHSVEVFDPITDQWDVLLDSTYSRQGAVSVVLQNMHYLIGGWDDSGFLAEHFIARQTIDGLKSFEYITKFEDFRAAIAAVTYYDDIYTTGGYGLSPRALFTRFNPRVEKYDTLSAMPSGRADHASVIVNNLLMVIGGVSWNDTSLNSIISIDLNLLPEVVPWINEQPLNHARESLAAVEIFQHVFVFGGYNRNTRRIVPTIESNYFPSTTVVLDPRKSYSSPDLFMLQQNYPNPFNNSTNISYQINSNQFVDVTLEIFDLTGKRVKSLAREQQHTGTYSYRWCGRDDRDWPVSSGVYVVRLTAGHVTQSRKIILIK